MALVLISSERFGEHQTPPGHPESPERADVMEVIANAWRAKGGEVVAPRAATREQLARVHDAVIFAALKKRRAGPWRSIPIPTRRRSRADFASGCRGRGGRGRARDGQ